jgi:hypothetical protein
MSQECPRCHLVNPPEAQACDCGYDFKSKVGQRRHDGSEQSQVGAVVSCAPWLVGGTLVLGIANALKESNQAGKPGPDAVGDLAFGVVLFFGVAAVLAFLSFAVTVAFWNTLKRSSKLCGTLPLVAMLALGALVVGLLRSAH